MSDYIKKSDVRHLLLHNDREAAIAQLDELESVDAVPVVHGYNTKWISVNERLPEFHEEVLVYAIGKEDAFTPVMAISEIYIFKLLPFSNGTIEWRDPWDYFNKNYKVTHWMPLPKAPDLT